MHKLNLTVCALALSVASFAGHAGSTGVVNFNGKLINETCQVDTASENIDVTLPTLPTQELAVAGAEKGSTSFEITVIGCDAGITKVAAHFEAVGSTGYNPVTGNLVNTAAAGADEVEVRLYNSVTGNTPIPVGQTGESFDVINNGVTNGAILGYAGGYYATGATTAGDVTAKVNYVLAYN